MASRGKGRSQPAGRASSRSRSRAEGVELPGASTPSTASTELRGEATASGAPASGSLVAQLTAKIEAGLHERLSTVQDELVAHIGTTLSEYDAAMQRRFSDIDVRAAGHDVRIGALEPKEAGAADRLAAWERELKLVASWDVRRVDVDEEWSRVPHLHVLRGNAPEPVAMSEVERLVAELMGRAGLEAAEDELTTMGRSPAKSWSITMAGAPQTAARRARDAIAALRTLGAHGAEWLAWSPQVTRHRSTWARTARRSSSASRPPAGE